MQAMLPGERKVRRAINMTLGMPLISLVSAPKSTDEAHERPSTLVGAYLVAYGDYQRSVTHWIVSLSPWSTPTQLDRALTQLKLKKTTLAEQWNTLPAAGKKLLKCPNTLDPFLSAAETTAYRLTRQDSLAQCRTELAGCSPSLRAPRGALQRVAALELRYLALINSGLAAVIHFGRDVWCVARNPLSAVLR